MDIELLLLQQPKDLRMGKKSISGLKTEKHASKSPVQEAY